ncbi:MAG: hypothetical protein H0U97_10415 [Gammaproteobacteria bacterium]|nr:hypothetical protein [Gammaproteobacteria bacterium]
MIDNDADAGCNRVKQNFGFSEWAGHTKEGDRNVRLTDFMLRPEALRGWKLAEKEDLPPSSRHQRVVRYI